MGQDKVRDEFEAWADKMFYQGLASVSDTWSDSRGGYMDYAHHMAYLAWQASREAVVVELPEWFDRFDSGDRTYWVEDVEKAIHAAGIRTR